MVCYNRMKKTSAMKLAKYKRRKGLSASIYKKKKGYGISVKRKSTFKLGPEILSY